jgi:allantoinase
MCKCFIPIDAIDDRADCRCCWIGESMTLYDLIIRNGTLVTAGDVSGADLAIADGKIVAVEPELAGTSRAQIDAAGLHVFPGVIDAHVHFNEPGRAEWEGFATGTRALAAGGATAYFDMPLNAHPPTLDATAFDQKLAAARASSLVDFALWGGLTPDNLDRLDELAERGVIGFKAFMSNSGIDDFAAADDLTLYEGMARAAQLGLIVAVHAESDQLTGALARRAVAAGRASARDYLRSRPVVAELEAIGRALLFAEETGCALHVVHVSTGRGVRLVAEARGRGVDVSCETCPHYLVLDEEDLERLGPLAKCAPPLRPAAEGEALWQLLRDGTLPMVASDHSPSPPSMKGLDSQQDQPPALPQTQNSKHRTQSFFAIWGGIAGCQSTLQLLLAEGYARRGLPLGTIGAATSGFVARRFGLAQRKGRLAPGADADLALVNVDADFVLRAEDLHYRHRISPYVGMALRGRVARTIVRGTTVFLDGAIVSPPIGRLLTPVPRST